MKKLTSIQLIFCALVAFSSTQAIAGATNADGTTTGTTADGTTADGTTTATPIVDETDMSPQGTADMNSSGMNNSSMDDLDDDEGDYGWIGLIGLAGLAGLMKRDRVDHTKTITR